MARRFYVSRKLPKRATAGGTTRSHPYAVVPAYAPGGLATEWVARAPGKEYRFNPCVPVTYQPPQRCERGLR